LEQFVINEWIWADISGANGNKGRILAINFLEAFLNSPHQIVIVLGSAFDKKAWQLCNHQEDLVKRIATLFVVQIRQTARARRIDPNELKELSDVLSAQVKDDDQYLARVLITIPEAILVTTDTKLLTILSEQKFKVISREEFLRTYFGIH
jgi:hypothetical protein